ncbi:MAG: ABC transporter substrate-binding protein [Burkholderiales bacterium]|nr:ABC transporter substrate-binding protein [Burkholderiales bacterium]
MIPRRKLLIASGAVGVSSVLVAPPVIRAQSITKVWRVGVLALRAKPVPGASDALAQDALVKRIAELGYREGSNLQFEWRYANQNLAALPTLAQELIQAKVDLIVALSGLSVQAAREATRTIPIVMAGVGDPVTSGYVASLARPGGNVTGPTTAAVETSHKLLEFLLAFRPKLATVTVLHDPRASPMYVRQISLAAQQSRIKLLDQSVENRAELDAALKALQPAKVGALIVVPSPFLQAHSAVIADAAQRARALTVFSFREGVVAGGLISYGEGLDENFRRAADYVVRIIKVAKPADLPVELPRVFNLAINKRTATALGLAIPQELLLRTDDIVE